MGRLSQDERDAVQKMLWEERKSFALSPDDIGDVPDLKMDLNTTDEVPVQKSYISIPRPLFNEVKSHLQDLFNRGWTSSSKSA